EIQIGNISGNQYKVKEALHLNKPQKKTIRMVKHKRNIIAEQNEPNTNIPNSNYLKENDLIKTINDQGFIFKENTTSISILKHGSPLIEVANYN
ncbi:15177_t:CDS:2, partial [Cetraspora pellucida]